jgi:hypothetical protein
VQQMQQAKVAPATLAEWELHCCTKNMAPMKKISLFFIIFHSNFEFFENFLTHFARIFLSQKLILLSHAAPSTSKNFQFFSGDFLNFF